MIKIPAEASKTIIGTFFLIGSFGASGMVQAHEGATGIVLERMESFLQSRGQMKQIQGALQAGDLAAVANISAKMQIWADKMGAYFPAGSDEKPSEAAASIWTDSEGFDKAITAYQTAVSALNEAALSGDVNATKAALGGVGGTCKSCHQSYRK